MPYDIRCAYIERAICRPSWKAVGSPVPTSRSDA